MTSFFRHRRSWLSVGAIIAAAGCFAGCAQVYDVKVDAMKNPEVQSGYSYRLITKEKGGADATLAEQRAEKLVRKALAGHGMYEAENPEDAEVVVEIDYDVGSQRIVAEADPFAGSPTMGPSVTYNSRDRFGRRVQVTEPISTGPRLRQIYEKRLTIVAREARSSDDGKERPPREIWRVEVRVEDEKDSVEEILPVLVGAAVDHIGTDNMARQTKRISDKSEPVSFVKEGS